MASYGTCTYVRTCVLIFLEKDRCKECQGEKVVRERKILEVGLYVHVYYYMYVHVHVYYYMYVHVYITMRIIIEVHCIVRPLLTN